MRPGFQKSTIPIIPPNENVKRNQTYGKIILLKITLKPTLSNIQIETMYETDFLTKQKSFETKKICPKVKVKAARFTTLPTLELFLMSLIVYLFVTHVE